MERARPVGNAAFDPATQNNAPVQNNAPAAQKFAPNKIFANQVTKRK
jgi:hypothetical protein